MERLSEREREVVRLVAEGMSNREIAERLVISVHTVRSHLQSISIKLGVNSRAKMAVAVIDVTGLIEMLESMLATARSYARD